MKKLLVALLALVSLAVVAAGCGGGDKKADNGADKKVTLKVGATAVPHAEILNQIKGTLAKEGSDRRRRIEDRRFARTARRHHQLRRAYAGEGRRKGQSD